MRIVEQMTAEKQKVSIVSELRKEKKFLGTINPKPGHAVWEFDMINRAVNEAKYEETVAVFPIQKVRRTGLKRKLLMKEGCMYVSALNKENAIKKFNRWSNKLMQS